MSSDAGNYHAGRDVRERSLPATAQRTSGATGERLGRRLLRWLALAGLTVLSVVVAVAGTFVHAGMVYAGTIPIPYGLVLALAGLTAVLLLVHRTARGRLGVVPVATAWLLPVWLLAQERPAGDVVISNGWAGLTYLFTGVVLIGAGVGLPRR